MNLSPKQLDAQSPVRIDKWIDVHSEESKDIDNNREFTLKCLRLGMKEPAFIFVDSDGRLWGKGTSDQYFPFHLEYGGQLIGLRLAAKASN